MKPWALGDLVITDEWQTGQGTWFSVLRDALGLAAIQGQTVERQGFWPAMAGVRRLPRRITLETHFLHGTVALQKAARTKLCLEAAAAQEQEIAIRLIAADHILPSIGPDNLKVALGPWDVRYSDGWKIRDLFALMHGSLGSGWAISNERLNITGTSSLTLAGSDLPGVLALEIWWKPADDYAYATDRYLFDGGDLRLYYRASDDVFVLTDGTTPITSAAQTFGANSLLHIVALWGTAQGLALFVNNTQASGTGHDVSLASTCYVGTDSTTTYPCRGELLAVRFYQGLTAAQVANLYSAGQAANDDPLSAARWLNVMPEKTDPLANRGKPTLDLVTTLAIDGDPRWRSRRGDYAHWDITSSPATKQVTVASDDDVYPVLLITPKSAKACGFLYKRWVPIKWLANSAATTYPIMIGTLDTEALVTAGKMQAGGDDLRVYVDDVETDRWLNGINTTTTRIWANLDFEAAQSATLESALGAGNIDTLDASSDISGFPNQGILLIDSEAFVYTGKNDADRRFLNVKRAAKGTTAASHSAGAMIYWVQHDVWIYYGDASLAAPTVNDDNKPIMALTSDNQTWTYTEFGEDSKNRPGGWLFEIVDDSDNILNKYTANHGASASPWQEMGIYTVPVGNTDAHWYLYNPCGILMANFTNGERYGNGSYAAYIRSSPDGITWTLEYTIDLATSSSWLTWSDNDTLATDAKYVDLRFYKAAATGGTYYVEVADVAITLSNYPALAIGGEQSNYPLDCTISNTTTGEAIVLALNMLIDEVLEVNTDEKTITNLTEGMGHLSALELVGGVRKHWLRLIPGNNSLQYAETGVADVDLDLVWDRRLFE